MLTPLTESIKSKANSFHPFSKIFLFIFFKLDFILCNDEINMLWKRKNKKWWMKGGEINGERRTENEM
jgi:hypothetical protein